MDRFQIWMIAWNTVTAILTICVLLFPPIRNYCIIGLIVEFVAYCAFIGILWYVDKRRWQDFVRHGETP